MVSQPVDTAVDARVVGRSSTLAARRRFLLLECLAFAAAVSVLFVILRDMLFGGRTTMTHDTVLWVYPIFTYFADGLLHGELPLWNPFSRGGEPLFAAYLQTRLFDPVDYLVVYVGAAFTEDLTTLFNWDRTVRMLLAALGTQLLIRRYAKHPVTRIALAFISVLSSITLNIFHQCGLNDQYYCAPFVAIFVFRILEGKRGWPNWLACLFFFGQCLQSYFFVGVSTFVILIVLGYAAFRRAQLLEVLRNRQTLPQILASAIILTVMASPSAVMLLLQNDFQMSARTYPDRWQEVPQESDAARSAAESSSDKSMIMMPYRFIRLTGTPVRPADLLGLLAPSVNDTKLANGTNPLTREMEGTVTSDSRLFIGGLAFLISLVGIAIGRHPQKRVWLVILAGFGLVMLGAYTPFHQILYQFYPPLWFMRHTQQLANFFLLALLFFFALGSDHLLTMCRVPVPSRAHGGQTWWRTSPPHLSAVTAAMYGLPFVLLASAGLVPRLARNSDSQVAFGSLLANPYIVTFVVAGAFLLTLSMLERLLVSEWQQADRIPAPVRGYPAPGLSARYHYLGSIAVASCLALLAFQWPDGPDQSAIPALDHAWRAAAVFVAVILSLAALDHLLTLRLSVDPYRQDWWRSSDRPWYSRLRGAARKRPVAFLGAMIFISVMWSSSGKDAFDALHELKTGAVTFYGANFAAALNILGLVATAQLALAFLQWIVRPRSVHFPLSIAQKIAGFAGLFVAVFAITTSPSPGNGTGVEGVTKGAFSLPWATNHLAAISVLAAANVVIAAISFGRRFAAALLATMVLVAASVLAEPGALLAHVILFLLLPAACFLLLRRYPRRWHREAVGICLVVLTAIELGLLVTEYRPEFQNPRTIVKKDWPVLMGGPAYPDTRVATIDSPPFSIDSDQVVRFVELLPRVGVALEIPASYPLKPFVADAEHLLGQPVWNTFFTLKSYNDLMKANLPPDVVESIFGIGAPIFQFKAQTKITSDFASDIRAVDAANRAAVLASTAFVDSRTLSEGRPLRRPPLGSTPAGEAAKITIQSLNYDRVSVVVEAENPGVLYFADAYTKDWIVTVNGARADLLRANGHFKAVEVGSGRSVVQFSYRPSALIWALRAFFGALALTAILALVGFAQWSIVSKRKPGRRLAPEAP